MQKNYRPILRYASAILCALSLLSASDLRADEPTPSANETERLSPSQLSQTVCELTEKVSPAVVTVYALLGPRMTPAWRMRELAKEQREQPLGSYRPVSSGSDSPDDQGTGIVIDAEGHVLTCNHVVAGANAVFVRTHDGRKILAKKVFCDPLSDLAVIQLETTDKLSPVRLGDSDELRVGDWVVSLASPYEMEHSVSVGIVSSTQRWVSSSPYPLIQNDACTNPGSSGGAILNLRGEVVGIIEGAMSTTGEFQGIGLATPINAAKEIAKQLCSQGYVERSQFGFSSQLLTADMATLLGLTVETGLYVTEVRPGWPASEAGLEIGDVIVKFNDHVTDESFDSQEFTADMTAGKQHRFTVVRDQHTIQIIAAMRQEERWIDKPRITIPAPAADSFAWFDDTLGLGFAELNEQLIRELELPAGTSGALITHVAVDSAAYREGVAAGMVIACVNDQVISGLTDFRNIVAHATRAKHVFLLLQSSTGKHLVLLKH